MTVDLGNSNAYNAFLDDLIGMVGQAGELEIQLKLGDVTSAEFRLRKSDLYIVGLKSGATGGWQELKDLNYNKMRSPETLSRPAVEQALRDSGGWLPRTVDEQKLKLIILVVSEAARFDIVRKAAVAAFHEWETFGYVDLNPIVTNWAKLSERTNTRRISIDHLKLYMSQVETNWDDSTVKSNLTRSGLLS